jgi:hypothetical protein
LVDWNTLSILLSQICGVYVIARVLTQETITERVRGWLIFHHFLFLHELFSCFFCMSFWVSLTTAALFQENIFVLMVGANLLYRMLRVK